MLTEDQLIAAYYEEGLAMSKAERASNVASLRRVEAAVRAEVARELTALANSDDGLDGFTAEDAVRWAAGRVRDGEL